MDPLPDEDGFHPPRLGPLAIFRRFFAFGCVAFGGPVAQIAWLRERFVERERWVSPERFRRTLAMYQALPGPEAHELCCWFGMIAGGRAGAIAAGLGFMLPGFVLMMLASWAYVHWGVEGGTAGAAFAAAQAAVAGLVLRAAWKLLGSLVHGRAGWIAAGLGGATIAAGGHFAIPLVAGGGLVALAATRRPTAAAALAAAAAIGIAWTASLADAAGASTGASTGVAAAATSADPLAIFRTGLIGGLITFGGAYTAIPVVEGIATGPGGWMSTSQFLDGVALAGVLPAPLVIFATFVGYAGGGPMGAVLATAGMFLPAFAFTLLGHATLERLLARTGWHAFLDGTAAAVAGMIAVTALVIFGEVTGVRADSPFAWPASVPTVIALAAFVIALRTKSGWMMPLTIASAALVGIAIG
jgi:chromate transporter